MMKISFRALLAALPLAAASCSDDAAENPAGTTGPVGVVIGSSPQIGIRPFTAVGEDGFTVRWKEGDRIALWARDDAGQDRLSAVPFSLWHYNEEYGDAKFRGEIDPMPEAAYTYYAVSPVPDASDGTKASYLIPAEQHGAFDGALDVMVAAPVEGPALQEGDNSERVNLRFSHKIHLLHIDISSNGLHEPITELELGFPSPATGRLTVDAAAPDAEPTLTEGSGTLRIALAEGADTDSRIYAAIAPVDIPAEAKITLRAYSATGASAISEMAGKHFAAGHTTPVRYHVPALEKRFTRLKFTLADTGEQTLGEKVDTLRFTVAEGTFDNGKSVREFLVDGAGDYYMTFRDFEDDLSGKTVTVSYLSENAAIDRTFTMPQLTSETTNEVAVLHVPYLFGEDFATVEAFDNHGSTSDHNGSTSALPGIAPGWTGNQCQAETGRAIRIRNRREYQTVSSFLGDSYGNYRGRVDSAPLSGIRPGHTVDIAVTFDYTGSTEAEIFQPLMNFGYETDHPEGITGYYNVEVGILGQPTSGGSKISNIVAANVALPLDGSFDGINLRPAEPYVIRGATQTLRLSWDIDASGKQRNTHKNQWLYLDNIRASIIR